VDLGFKIARWWLRWPVYSTLFFLVLVALSWDGKTHASWLITLASFAAVVGFVAALADRKDSLAARDVVKDLSPQQRSQAMRATRRGPVPADPAVLHAATRLAQPSLGKKGDPWGLMVVGIFTAISFDDLNRINMLGVLCLAAIGSYQMINPARLDARAQLLDQATKHAELDPGPIAGIHRCRQSR
jgi:hypothetical protein